MKEYPSRTSQLFVRPVSMIPNLRLMGKAEARRSSRGHTRVTVQDIPLGQRGPNSDLLVHPSFSRSVSCPPANSFSSHYKPLCKLQASHTPHPKSANNHHESPGPRVTHGIQRTLLPQETTNTVFPRSRELEPNRQKNSPFASPKYPDESISQLNPVRLSISFQSLSVRKPITIYWLG